MLRLRSLLPLATTGLDDATTATCGAAICIDVVDVVEMCCVGQDCVVVAVNVIIDIGTDAGSRRFNQILVNDCRLTYSSANRC